MPCVVHVPVLFNDSLANANLPGSDDGRNKKLSMHVYTRGSVTPSITLGLHARGDADMKSWEELVIDGWSMWDWCGGCSAGTEAKEKNFVTDSPDGKTYGRWFMAS